MKSSVAILRQIIREQIETIMEYRPNAFMLSQMEEQDQDGDGDEDFDDVRMARFQKGGMTRDAALSKVSKSPLGKPGSKIKSSSGKK
jgi:hypothetical protein